MSKITDEQLDKAIRVIGELLEIMVAPTVENLDHKWQLISELKQLNQQIKENK